MIVVEDFRVLQAAAQTATHSPWLVEFIEQWRREEQTRLAYAKEDDFRLKQGRIQVLDEVLRLFTQAESDLRRAANNH